MPRDEHARERFETLFRENHGAVRAFARRRVPAESVDDIVSETFLVAWRRLDSVPAEPLPWLLGVTRNVVGTERRGQARRLRLWIRAQGRYLEAQEPIEAPTSDDTRVLLALGQLSERDREALTLVAWDGLTPAEAADVLGMPVNRFRVRLHRAGQRLRCALVSDPQQEDPVPNQLLSQTGSKGPAL